MIVPLAYKFVALTMMLAEINFCSRRLNLPEALPITDHDIHMETVFPPSIIGFAGRLDTSKYSFVFAKSGRLRFITDLDNGRSYETMREHLENLSQTRSMIGTNEAYEIAYQLALGYGC